MSANAAAASLLQLPDPCLLLVLRFCAGEQRIVCSAARAHSRLHRAAVEALSSITAYVDEQKMDSLQLYLRSYGQYVSSIRLRHHSHFAVHIHELPSTLKLSNLKCQGMSLQLLPCDRFAGVLSAASTAALKQLELKGCELLDEPSAQLMAVLKDKLPDLQHLSLDQIQPQFIDASMQPPEQLTHLEFDASYLQVCPGIEWSRECHWQFHLPFLPILP